MHHAVQQKMILPITWWMQVPGSTAYSLALYYMMDTPLEKVPLLERFVNGDDSFRNSRFKLIPYISKVPILNSEAYFILFKALFNQNTNLLCFNVNLGILDC
jgi:hypothetical protein